ncbi:MAG: hypothetical protein AB9880_05370 [Christensenellales bacterium]
MQKKRGTGQPSRADKFWSIFLFTKDGKVKSPTLIYSFSLSIVLIALYALAYYFLIDAVHMLFLTSPAWLRDLMESLLPALLASAVLCLLQGLSGNKKYLPAAYLWLLVYALFILGWMLLALEAADDKAFFLALFIRLVPGPLLTGGICSWLMHLRAGRKPGGAAAGRQPGDAAPGGGDLA